MGELSKDKSNQGLLQMLLKSKPEDFMNPLQQSGLKTAQKVQSEWIEDAMRTHGVSATEILKQLGLNMGTPMPDTSSSMPKAPTQTSAPAMETQMPQGEAPEAEGMGQENMLASLLQLNQAPEIKTKAASSPFGFGGVSMQDGQLTEQKPGILAGLLSVLATGAPDAGARQDISKLLKMKELQGGVGNTDMLDIIKEQRRAAAEERLQTEQEKAFFDTTGGIVSEKDIKKWKNRGLDLEAYIKKYGVESYNDPETGERKWDIPDKDMRKEMVSNQTLKPTEVEFLSANQESRKRLTNVLDLLGEAGYAKGAFEVQKETINSPFGLISFPARIKLADQYLKDPRYVSAKQELEAAFQAYRKIITGAQASTQELNLLRPIYAAFTDRPEVFFQRMKDLIKSHDDIYNIRLKHMEAAGRNVKKFKQILEESQSGVPGAKRAQPNESGFLDNGQKPLIVKNDQTGERLKWENGKWQPIQ